MLEALIRQMGSRVCFLANLWKGQYESVNTVLSLKLHDGWMDG